MYQEYFLYDFECIKSRKFLSLYLRRKKNKMDGIYDLKNDSKCM